MSRHACGLARMSWPDARPPEGGADAHDPSTARAAAPAATDRDAFVAAMSASRDLHRPWVSPPTTAAAFDRWLERYERDERYEPMLAVRRDDGAIVGFLNLAEMVRGLAPECLPRLRGGRRACRARLHDRGRGARARARVRSAAPASRRGEHPAGQHGLDRARAPLRLRPRGLFGALPQDQRALVRRRALGARAEQWRARGRPSEVATRHVAATPRSARPNGRGGSRRLGRFRDVSPGTEPAVARPPPSRSPCGISSSAIRSRRSTPSTGSRSRSAAARSSACSGPTAPARRRPSAC